MAPAKQATTMIVQSAFPKADLDLEIWPRPWIVALSKNSDRMAKCILEEKNVVIASLSQCLSAQLISTDFKVAEKKTQAQPNYISLLEHWPWAIQNRVWARYGMITRLPMVLFHWAIVGKNWMLDTRSPKASKNSFLSMCIPIMSSIFCEYKSFQIWSCSISILLTSKCWARQVVTSIEIPLNWILWSAN